MIKNYLKTGWRSIRKNSFYSFLNIFGLAIGIGFTLLMAAYVWTELGVNKQLKNANRQYIIQSKWKDPGMGYDIATLGPLAKALKEQYPSLVANYYRYDGVSSNVSKGDKVFREDLQIGDSTLLTMYGLQLLQGNPATALKDPFSVVITEDRAIKFFGKKNVVGETITVENFSGSKHDFLITGVLKKLPGNSVTGLVGGSEGHLFFSANAANYFGRVIESWNNPSIANYVELQNGVRAEDLQGPIQRLVQQNAPPQVAANLTPFLMPLSDYHLKQNNGLVQKMIYSVSSIALFILAMTIINFISISISKSSQRIREIGVRKVLGGSKKQLIFQFLIESVLLTLFAASVALVIYQLSLPFVSGILNKELPPLLSFPLPFGVAAILIALVVGCLAGLYPAFVLSTLKAVDSIKGKLKSIKENVFLRKSLLGFQFFTASLVFVGAIIIAKQVSLFFASGLGYDKEYIVSAQLPRDWTQSGVQHMEMIRDEFAKMPEVSNASLSWQMPNGWDIGKLPVFVNGKDSTQAIATQSLVADEKYAETYKIPMVAGTFFRDANDSLSIIINETAAKDLGWNNTSDAVGKRLMLPGNASLTVIGVTKDFHFGSMQQKILPISFVNVSLYKAYRFLSFKLEPGNISKSIEALQKKWSALLPGAAFEYIFMDDALAKMYTSEIQLKKASQLATILAFIIVMLGIIGLTSLSIQKRTKEIGIRKVLGASASSISFLFIKEFLPVLLISAFISIPIGWYVMQGWLSDYAYRISLSAQPFLISISIIVVFTVSLILLQIWKSSIENPVKNLRTE